MNSWNVGYQKLNPIMDIHYQSIGSGGGVKQFTAKIVDFGASEPRGQQYHQIKA